MNAREKCQLLAIEITPVTKKDLLNWISEQIRGSKSSVLAGHNLHSSYLFHTDVAMRNFYDDAEIVLADGAPVFWDYHLSGGKAKVERLGSTDWIPDLGAVVGLLRVCVVGASQVSNRRFVTRLRRLIPDTTVVGCAGANWSGTGREQALSTIQDFCPQLLLIGLGMPMQEGFAGQVRALCTVPVIATIGGAIEQIAGDQRNAPRWLGRVGLEWAWRLFTQPRRLWKRYTLEPWMLLAIRLRQVLRVGSR